MDEEIKTIEEQETAEMSNDELKNVIEDRLAKIQRQNLLLGAQSMCKVILNKIYAFEKSPGSKSANDYKRCLKDIKKFCETGLSRKVNADGETESTQANETVQN